MLDARPDDGPACASVHGRAARIENSEGHHVETPSQAWAEYCICMAEIDDLLLEIESLDSNVRSAEAQERLQTLIAALGPAELK
jgi:hypothetical protein